MSTKDINSRRSKVEGRKGSDRIRIRFDLRPSTFRLVLALAVGWTAAARAGGDYEEARLNAGAGARDLAVSQQVEELLKAKEAQVAERRRAGIVLIEIYLREHPPSVETP